MADRYAEIEDEKAERVTPAEATSVRRALRLLAGEGLAVDLGRGWHSGRRHWATPAEAAAYAGRVRAAFGDRAVHRLPDR